MKKIITALFIGVMSLLAASSPAPAQQQYELIELDTLRGNTSRARSISENGIIAGSATHPTNGPTAVLWEYTFQYSARELGPPPNSATGVNDSGHASGVFEGSSSQSDESYFWDGDSWTPLGHLPGMTDTKAEDIEASDRIVGRSFTLSGGVPTRAFIWEAGVMTDLGTLGGNASAFGINDVGQVAGHSRLILSDGSQASRAFLWEDGVMENLGVLAGEDFSQGFDVNDNGDVVGSSWHSISPVYPPVHLATMWRNGGTEIIDLGRTPDPQFTCGGPYWPVNIAIAVNNHGQVVGHAHCISSGGARAAFLYEDGEMKNLNDLIPADSGWNLIRAEDINDAGQIVAWGTHSSRPGHEHLRSVLLEPLIPCTVDLECDDGRFCDGVEQCVDGICREGSNPCPGLVCDEDGDTCEPETCDFDGTCELGENCNSCPSDCMSSDGSQACGDGICQPGIGEDCLSCSADCRGKQTGKQSSRFCCGEACVQDNGNACNEGGDFSCWDPRCNEDGAVCDDTQPSPYCCGDGVCDPGESQCDCPVDCGTPLFVEFDCTDGVDNDCDGVADDEDSNCCGQPGDVCGLNSDCCSGRCKISNKWPLIGTCR